ncbi:basic phospholipase A2 F17-like [Chiloscyllium plagiosum]|uniref:basic phospholipase A2 F17-like n=1 Tax=Chiloscyllium plagiosum TaxID=36176 RepID=UPI001CB8155E|nr:basic phospholipase A2 F17-like [Chiloscyllium plagiosum]
MRRMRTSRFLVMVLPAVIWLCLCPTAEQRPGATRQRRGLFDMAMTLWCYRSKLGISLLKLHNYGCYCGTGGSSRPVDQVDQCCFLHDCCYYHTRVILGCHSQVKWSTYNFTCKKAQTECKGQTVCTRMSCECDRAFAECLSRAKPSDMHYFYKTRFCKENKSVCPATFPNSSTIMDWIKQGS